MKKSSKKGRNDKSMTRSHLVTLHQRLYHALDLGFRYSVNMTRKWQSNDVEMQKLVVRTISAFVDCISVETLCLPLVKDSVADIATALGGILQCKNEAVLDMATIAVLKLVRTLNSTTLQPHVAHLAHPLASSLSFHLLQVAVTCAAALKLIISKLSNKKESEVWEILKETDAAAQIISNLRKFSDEMKSIEYFVEMASLLSAIMQRWPPSRYPVWTNAKLREILGVVCVYPDAAVKVAVLQLCFALALCGNAAQQILDNGDALTTMIVNCMGNIQIHSVRILAFKLAQRLMVNEQGVQAMIGLSCEPIVNSIISGMSDWTLQSEKVSDDHLSLLKEACRLALITRWPGKHQASLWKHGVDRVLLNLIINNFHITLPPQKLLSQEEIIAMAREGLNADFLLLLRPYVWEILGWLAAHCDVNFHPNKQGNANYLNVLITIACLAFVDAIGSKRQLCQADCSNTSRSVSASKATFMMIYSPCKYIAFRARIALFEILRFDGEERLEYLLDAVNFSSLVDKSKMPNMFQITINMISLACYSASPQFCRHLIESRGINTLLGFVRWWLNNHFHIESMSLASHLRGTTEDRTCCVVAEEWEGTETLLLLAFWSLTELINHCDFEGIQADIYAWLMIHNKEHLIKEVQDICISASSSGLRWYCSYFLSFLGFYGFPSKLGKRIGTALGEKEQTDVRLLHHNGEPLSAHGVLLLVRCPSLLPSQEPPCPVRTSDCSSAELVADNKTRVQKEISLSAKVDYQALVKLLEFIYTGNLQAGDDLVAKLKLFARHCNLQPLLQLLCRKRPNWGAPIPKFDLSIALGSSGHEFSDMILEAKSSGKTHWTCGWCSLSAQHFHVHKIILWSSCEYFRALIQSGMQESHSQTLKVPVSWEALHKLVVWFYSGELPRPLSGCLWNNMDVERKLCEMQPYVELWWLAEFWFLDDIWDECSRIVTRCLDSAWQLSVKIIQVAADFSLWKLVEVAAGNVAPFYHDLRKSSALDMLDEQVVDMIRAASVQLAQQTALEQT
ncbi:hypothetical protein Nepgr_015215 [Nepenthes gracilis]|uniref:BTB domain-containing protein n=1 Tax=Nepenthes gracilis TaxID=150966 RepID=A0AAD3SMD4_NEPGR|nr:hypothetical protein Nepgr_015215 [Nepenthes gracilis]